MKHLKQGKEKYWNQRVVPVDMALERRTMTSIPDISVHGSLILWAKFHISVGPRPCVGHRSGREGEKYWLLDHIRQILFVHQLCSLPIHKSISIYIERRSSCFFHVVGTLCLGMVHVCRVCMRSTRTTLVVQMVCSSTYNPTKFDFTLA